MSRRTAPETIYDHPTLVRSRFATVDGYRTHYLESGAGDGQPLVLLHGANWDFGLGADRWFPTIVPLGRTFRVIAPDQLGGGQTDAPRDLSRIGNLQDRAQHMLDFVEGLGVGPVHLVGQSQGAWIAAFIALRRPDLVGGLVLVDSSSVAMPPGGMSAKGLASRFEVQVVPGTMVNRKISEGDDVAGGVRQWLEANVHSPDVLIDPYLDACLRLADTWAPIWREPWRASWADPAAHQAQYLVDGEPLGLQVHRLPPSLLIWRKAPLKIFESGAALYQRMPEGSEFYVLDRADHFLWQDRSTLFNSLVRWYLTADG
jgi:pimeloyl-ACP methyl ester carboxylesterase